MTLPDPCGCAERSRRASRLTTTLPHDSTAPGRARMLVSEFIGSSSLREDALQVASELTANAVRHGQPPCLLSISADDRDLRIEVSQANDLATDGQPVLRDDRFGLHLVAALSQSWGTSVEREHGHTVRRTVWAQIANSTSSGPSPARLGSPSQG